MTILRHPIRTHSEVAVVCLIAAQKTFSFHRSVTDNNNIVPTLTVSGWLAGRPEGGTAEEDMIVFVYKGYHHQCGGALGDGSLFVFALVSEHFLFSVDSFSLSGEISLFQRIDSIFLLIDPFSPLYSSLKLALLSTKLKKKGEFSYENIYKALLVLVNMNCL